MRNIGSDREVRHRRDEVAVVEAEQLGRERGAGHLDLGKRLGLEAFDHEEIEVIAQVPRDDGVEAGLLVAVVDDGRLPAPGDDRLDHTGPPGAVAVLFRLVDLEPGVGMLQIADPQAGCGQEREDRQEESGLAAVVAADEGDPRGVHAGGVYGPHSSTQVIPEPVAGSVPWGVVNLFDKVQAISGSAHTGRALKAAKLLNLVGTVRGAVTTVLLASSAIGGAVTVNNVRQDIVAKDQVTQSSRPAAAVRNTAAPSPTPLTAAGLRADAERRLRTALDQDASGVDDLRKVSVLSGEATDALVAQTREKLQARFDLALSQIDVLLGISPLSIAATTSASPRPSQSLSVVTVNSLVQVALGDMSGIVFVATRTATTTPPVQTIRQTNAPTPVPTVAHTAAPTLTPRTPAPTVKPSPTR